MVERRPRRRPRGGSALTAFCCHRGERGATHGVRPRLRVLPRPLCRYASIILVADDAWLLTELSNVVAYPCRHSRAEDRPMSTVRSTTPKSARRTSAPLEAPLGSSPIGHSLAETAGTGRLPAGPKHWMQASGDQRFGHQCFFAQFFQGLG